MYKCSAHIEIYNEINLNPSSFDISAGEKALFSCATDANIAGLTATWLKDNKPVGDALADRVKVK